MASALLIAGFNPRSCNNTLGVVDGQQKHCDNAAQGVCTRCSLVQYCSAQCMYQHRHIHEGDCISSYITEDYQPPWVRDNRPPGWKLSQGHEAHNKPVDLWGNMPAIDILNLRNNECIMDEKHYPDSSNILFAASGDLRDTIRTIGCLPQNYPGRVNIFVNDAHYHITYRNIILLIITFVFEPRVAVPMMIHVWYSAFLPGGMVTALQEKVLSNIESVCQIIQNQSEDKIHSATWKCNRSTLVIALKKKEWDELRRVFRPSPPSLSFVAAQKIRIKVMNNPQREDFIEKTFYQQSSAMRASKKKFRERGVLLPFGSSAEGFDTPNPTLFWLDNYWPLGENSDPLSGWHYGEYRQADTIMQARNDIYGSLSCMLTTIIGQFCLRLRTTPVTLRLSKSEPRDIEKDFAAVDLTSMRFDRIDTSSLVEDPYYGPEAIFSIFAPMLKSVKKNPKATLLALFKTTVPKIQEKHKYLHHQEMQKVDQARVSKYIDVSSQEFQAAMRPENRETNPIAMLYDRIVEMMVDYDKFLGLYMEEEGIQELATRSGLKLRDKHSIVAPWPYRIEQGLDPQWFASFCSLNTVGCERYMEFVKVAE